MSWSTLDLLLKGGWWEVLPEDRLHVLHAARRYAKDPRLSKRDRDYIERMWLQGDPAPGQLAAWEQGEGGTPGA